MFYKQPSHAVNTAEVIIKVPLIGEASSNYGEVKLASVDNK
jgi:hypothetical protein